VTSELFGDVSQAGARSLTPQQLEHIARLPPSLLHASSELNYYRKDDFLNLRQAIPVISLRIVRNLPVTHQLNLES